MLSCRLSYRTTYSQELQAERRTSTQQQSEFDVTFELTVTPNPVRHGDVCAYDMTALEEQDPPD